MSASRFLCAGTAWDERGALLRLQGPDGTPHPLRLDPGTELRFRVLAGPGRCCLGYDLVQEAGRRSHTCPEQAAAVRGFQCGRCFARDESRLVHNSHRGGPLPAGLRRYLARPQWLYVATFADGTTKVGTAAESRRILRLTEQGAVAARYVARAANGMRVRVLEDAVSSQVGLTQAVRSSNKCAALAAPLAPETLTDLNTGHAEAVRAFLLTLEPEGFEVLRETWSRPAAFDTVLGHRGAGLYPQPLSTGEHGLLIHGMLGSSALAATDDVGPTFLADLGQLRGHRLELGPYRSTLPALQPALF